jgi:hypothetical protein
MEAEVFLCGSWKNYDELESSLSLPELILTLGAMRKKDFDDKKFFAAMKGVDLESNKEDPLQMARERNAAKENITKGVHPDDVIANPIFSPNQSGGILYETI